MSCSEALKVRCRIIVVVGGVVVAVCQQECAISACVLVLFGITYGRMHSFLEHRACTHSVIQHTTHMQLSRPFVGSSLVSPTHAMHPSPSTYVCSQHGLTPPSHAPSRAPSPVCQIAAVATDVAGEQVARRAGDRAEAAERDAGEEVRCCVDYLIDVISGQGAEIQVNALQRDLMAEAVARETDVANALDLAGDAVKDVHEKVEEMDNKMAALEGRIATQIGEEKSDRIKHEHATEEAAALVEKEHDTAHAVLEGHIDEQVANWTVGRCLDSLIVSLEESAVQQLRGDTSAAVAAAVTMLDAKVGGVRGALEGVVAKAGEEKVAREAGDKTGEAKQALEEGELKALEAKSEAREKELAEWKEAEEKARRTELDAMREQLEGLRKQQEENEKKKEDEEAAAAAVPPEPPRKKIWEKVYDKEQGAHFYRNLEDKSTTWEKPDDFF